MSLVIKCPTCKKKIHYTPDNPYRPFCSKRCRLIDLGQWLEEDYKIADDPDNFAEEKSRGRD